MLYARRHFSVHPDKQSTSKLIENFGYGPDWPRLAVWIPKIVLNNVQID